MSSENFVFLQFSIDERHAGLILLHNKTNTNFL